MSTHDAQMLKGVLALLLLSLLETEDSYGYGIVTRLREAGFDGLAEGTVYPALTRLEAAGLLESYLARSDSGPARKYYTTTAAGREELLRRGRAWDALVAAVAQVMAPAVPAVHPPTHTTGA
ncbi:MAG TPA: PadR family transcriptional regulator [Intrasporangiaceae bacterium]|nr:PadR family transcriptional regulator [Intrasporangiaceae bacterium]